MPEEEESFQPIQPPSIPPGATYDWNTYSYTYNPIVGAGSSTVGYNYHVPQTFAPVGMVATLDQDTLNAIRQIMYEELIARFGERGTDPEEG